MCKLYGIDRMTSGIFISYRRSDSKSDARSICQRLEKTFGKGKVFIDVDSIRPGRNFQSVLKDDLGYFPRYDALVLYRQDVPQRFPQAWAAMQKLEGTIDERAMENAIPDAYLRRLHRLYEDWFASYDLSPIVRVDTGEVDYVENLVDLIDLRRTLDEALA